MRRLFSLIAVCAGLGVALVGSAQAITGGQPDGTNHPYVGLLDNAVFVCSGTLISPTILITAAHCFSDSTSGYGTNTVTGAPIVSATFDPDGFFNPTAEYFFGSYYFDPDFCIGCGGGLPGFITHDVAVVVFTNEGCSFCGPIPTSVTSTYGSLPAQGLVDTLKMKTPLDLVGYGVQSFRNGGGPCGGPCTPTPDAFFTRFTAQAKLTASNFSISSEFVKFNSSKGGTCFGDSGGPAFLAGSTTFIAVTSFGTNAVCKGQGYSYRIDTPEALSFIDGVIATYGP